MGDPVHLAEHVGLHGGSVAPGSPRVPTSPPESPSSPTITRWAGGAETPHSESWPHLEAFRRCSVGSFCVTMAESLAEQPQGGHAHLPVPEDSV